MIDPSFWTDEKLGECSIQERFLFAGLFSQADDEGYGRANPKLLKSLIFPYDDDLRASDIKKWLSRLGGLGLVVLYTVNGQAYYYLPNFTKHQTINRPTASTFPKPEDGILDNNAESLTEDSVSTHGTLTPKRKEEKRREEKGREEKRARGEYQNVILSDEDIEKLMSEYPTDWQDRIEKLSAYMESTGKKYKNHLATIRNWARMDSEKQSNQSVASVTETISQKNNFVNRQYDESFLNGFEIDLGGDKYD